MQYDHTHNVYRVNGNVRIVYYVVLWAPPCAEFQVIVAGIRMQQSAHLVRETQRAFDAVADVGTDRATRQGAAVRRQRRRRRAAANHEPPPAALTDRLVHETGALEELVHKETLARGQPGRAFVEYLDNGWRDV